MVGMPKDTGMSSIEKGVVTLKIVLQVLFVFIAGAFALALVFFNTNLSPRYIIFIGVPFFGLIGAITWLRLDHKIRGD